jgi:hypothetical protein
MKTIEAYKIITAAGFTELLSESKAQLYAARVASNLLVFRLSLEFLRNSNDRSGKIQRSVWSVSTFRATTPQLAKRLGHCLGPVEQAI